VHIDVFLAHIDVFLCTLVFSYVHIDVFLRTLVFSLCTLMFLLRTLVFYVGNVGNLVIFTNHIVDLFQLDRCSQYTHT